MPEEFSVLLPCYAGDQAEALAVSLRSVTSGQTLRPDEVVVVVDGPVTLGLDAVLADGAAASPVPVRVLRLPTNLGLGPALEAGLAACSHDLVARQDADDVSMPGRFAAQLPLIAAGHDLVGSALTEFETDPSVRGQVRVPPLRPEAIIRDSRFAQPVFHPTVVYRRSVVAAVGGYEDLPGLEDYWLFARMIVAGARVANVAEPLVRYRVGAGSYSRRGGLRLLRSEIELQRRFRRIGFTTRWQLVRNLLVRGVYRLVPERVRRTAYGLLLARRGHR